MSPIYCAYAIDAFNVTAQVYVDENRKSAMMCFDDWDVTDLSK